MERGRRAWSTLKTAVVAPIPTASVAITTAAKPDGVELSTGVAQILQDVLDARPTPRRARVFGDARQVPEVATRSLPCGFGRFTRLDALL